MTPAELLAEIDARAAVDPEFAGLVAARRAGDVLQDRAIAAALSAGRTRARSRLITERGIIAALGPVEGEALLSGLEDFAAATLAPGHQLAASHAGIKRVIGWLKPPSEGVDIGDPLTATLLGTLATLGTPGITQARVDSVLALAREPDPISYEAVGLALSQVA